MKSCTFLILGLMVRMSAGQGGSVSGGDIVEGAPVVTNITYPPIVQGGSPPPQIPGVWDALDALRGKPALETQAQVDLLASARPGVDYPILAQIPAQTSFSCANVKQAGYYTDIDFQCQVFRRCDVDGVETSYLCPNQTVFNQITLICDWFFNVNCANSAQYQDYSNARLYHIKWPLLDTPPWQEAAAAARAAGNAARLAGAAAAAAGAADHGQSA